MAENRLLLESENVYHIWSHANGNENLFKEENNYFYFLEKYQKYILPIVDTYAYCLMPNHFHLMIRIKPEDTIINYVKNSKPSFKNSESPEEFSKIISLQFSHLFNAYTQAYNKVYKRKGSLFIPNFKRKLIEDESYYSWLILYIHRNPIHHGFSKKFEDWKFSSYKSYLSNGNTKIKKNEVLEWFGGLKGFQEFHSGNLPGEISMYFE